MDGVDTMRLNHRPWYLIMAFTITDIGDKGRFTPPGVNDSFYSKSESNSDGALDCVNMS